MCDIYKMIHLWSVLTYWGRVTHICVSKLTIIGSDNGLSPGWHQAIIWTNAGILLIRPLGTNLSEILIEIYTFSFKKIHLNMSSGNGDHFVLASAWHGDSIWLHGSQSTLFQVISLSCQTSLVGHMRICCLRASSHCLNHWCDVAFTLGQFQSNFSTKLWLKTMILEVQSHDNFVSSVWQVYFIAPNME